MKNNNNNKNNTSHQPISFVGYSEHISSAYAEIIKQIFAYVQMLNTELVNQ